jgi:hypothetical protein
MPPDRDQYVQFTIKLLKGSFALNALWQDAVKYHMIDQPDKLIALRLTEYYEMVARGASPSGFGMQGMPVAQVTQTPAPAPTNTGTLPTPQPTPVPAPRVPAPAPQRVESQSELSGQINDIVTSSAQAVVEQNADEAADYWTAM